MKKKIFYSLMLSLILLITLTGCVPGDGTHSLSDPAGFLWGVWHGWLAPLSLILNFFDKNIRLYEVYNSGWWYDFGFYMAIISGFGGLSLFRNKRKDNR